MNRNSLIFLGIIAVLGAWLYFSGKSSYNTMVELKEQVEAQWGQVRNVYQRRADLIPNLVNTVQGYKDFEQSTLTQVAEARAKVGQLTVDREVLENPELMKKFTAAQGELGQVVSRLLSVAENYPDLKANVQFQDLMTQLEGTENRISVERMKFNDEARKYNTHIKKFPTNIFAGFFDFDPMPYFEGEEGIEQAPEVQFN